MTTNHTEDIILNRSQPLSSKVVKKLKLDKGDCSADSKILYEYVGNMFDFLDDGENKITLSDRTEWLCKDIKGAYRDLLRIIHNHKRTSSQVLQRRKPPQ